jgi:hypothetical protein
MSLELSESHGITAKTGLPCECHGRGQVNIYRLKYAATKKFPAFDACITMSDFVAMMQYVLENTTLEGKSDPRALFVKYARTLAVKKVPGEGLRIVQEKKRKAR